MATLQEKVADLVDFSGLTVAFIARHAGIHRGAIERIYKGEQKEIMYSAGVKIDELWELYQSAIKHFGPGNTVATDADRTADRIAD